MGPGETDIEMGPRIYPIRRDLGNKTRRRWSTTGRSPGGWYEGFAPAGVTGKANWLRQLAQRVVLRAGRAGRSRTEQHWQDNASGGIVCGGPESTGIQVCAILPREGY